MENSRKTIPTAYGRAVRDIYNHHSSFKAEEWSGWLLYYSPILLRGRLRAELYESWLLQSKWQLTTKLPIKKSIRSRDCLQSSWPTTNGCTIAMKCIEFPLAYQRITSCSIWQTASRIVAQHGYIGNSLVSGSVAC